ncbi:hypothetical protein AT302_10020 [Pandoraea norimbergensis]|uniref:Uncharacterized protein n=1 Tax=Pandoraea norimbergensis TaxID=93219 RepID=A0ABM5WJC8_9BURK|nr:hypothetical protein AT302_10020 [Pandoraea norimbergensis]
MGVTPVARAVGGTGAASCQIERVGAHTGAAPSLRKLRVAGRTSTPTAGGASRDGGHRGAATNGRRKNAIELQ